MSNLKSAKTFVSDPSSKLSWIKIGILIKMINKLSADMKNCFCNGQQFSYK